MKGNKMKKQKIVFYPQGKLKDRQSQGTARITVQFRVYDKHGHYDTDQTDANATIHIKDMSLNKAYNLISGLLAEHENMYHEIL